MAIRWLRRSTLLLVSLAYHFKYFRSIFWSFLSVVPTSGTRQELWAIAWRMKYSLANSFYKILKHLRSPVSKEMAETSTTVTRNQESFQLPKHNGKIDAGSNSSKLVTLGKNSASASGSPRSKMAKQSMAPKHVKGPSSAENNCTGSSKTVVCNGKAPDLQADAK